MESPQADADAVPAEAELKQEEPLEQSVTVEKLASAEWLPERSAGFFPKLLALLVLAGVSASTVVFVLWGLVR